MQSIAKVSIVTVVKNSAVSIPLTMESILSQSYRNRECIVIDGGSTDGTLEYLQSICNKLAVLVSERDNGIYDAMNKGIVKSSGDYIMFMNAGDRFREPESLEAMMRHVQENNIRPDIVSGRIQFEYEGRLLNLFKPAIVGKEGRGLPHQATLIARNLAQKNLFDVNFKMAGDYELWRRLQAANTFDVLFFDDVVAVFSFGGLTTNVQNDSARYLEKAFIDYRYDGRFGVFDWFKVATKIAVRRLVFSLFGERILLYAVRFIRSQYRKVPERYK